MNANGSGLATPKGVPVRRPPDPGWSPLVHAGEPRKVCHEAGGGSAARASSTISKTVAKSLFERKLTAADFYEDSDEGFWDEVDADWACGICNDDGGDGEQGGDVEQDGARDGSGVVDGMREEESAAAKSCGFGRRVARLGDDFSSLSVRRLYAADEACPQLGARRESYLASRQPPD